MPSKEDRDGGETPDRTGEMVGRLVNQEGEGTFESEDQVAWWVLTKPQLPPTGALSLDRSQPMDVVP